MFFNAVNQTDVYSRRLSQKSVKSKTKYFKIHKNSIKIVQHKIMNSTLKPYQIMVGILSGQE